MATKPASSKRAAVVPAPAVAPVPQDGLAAGVGVTGPVDSEAQTPAIPRSILRVGDGLSREDFSRIEWLLTDGSGGFAMGTASGIPTRRYHGWFISALRPPVGRVLLLHSVIGQVSVHPGDPARERTFELSSYRFPGNTVHPGGIDGLVEFQQHTGVSWTYEFATDAGVLTVRRELALLSATMASVRFTVSGPGSRGAGVRLLLRPLVGMRDFHETCERRRAESAGIAVGSAPGVVTVRGHKAGALEVPTLHMAVRAGEGTSMFGGPSQWWHDFEYARDRDRGQSCLEDLYAPGVFTVELPPSAGEGAGVELRAWIGAEDPGPTENSGRAAGVRLSAAMSRIGGASRAGGAAGKAADPEVLRRLVAAADQFVVRRRVVPWLAKDTAPGESASVIAGYPWFSDWGRDAMISLPGLLLTTGRFAEARSLLEGFAAMCKGGLVPNCFDNGTGTPEYNTVDASLWFIHAACRYAIESGDEGIAGGPIGATCMAIIEAYQQGTEFKIRVDPSDGLVSAGDSTMQLTWMDARRDGVVFTPRAGKAVEINALWYNALSSVARLMEPTRPRTGRDLHQIAERVRASFQGKFFDAYRRMCFDLVPGSGGDGGHGGIADPAYQVRPNQIFAVSLPHSPLNAEQQEAVVKAVRGSLLTPVGLRTLAASDRQYQGRYEGNLFNRDRAYHNGTVWPWLMGPYAEAVMRVGQFSTGSRLEAGALLRPLIGELMTPRGGRAVGQVAEVYDGDDSAEHPRRPDGCPAQAWSVAELLRVYVLAAG